VIDVKVCRGANCDSDHYLVKVRIRQKISSAARAKGGRRIKWNIEKLKTEQVVEEYQNEVTRNLTVTCNNEGMANEWSNIECAVINATSQTLGKKNPRQNEDWFDQECANAMNAIIKI